MLAFSKMIVGITNNSIDKNIESGYCTSQRYREKVSVSTNHQYIIIINAFAKLTDQS
jgi:hypothetical protein